MENKNKINRLVKIIVNTLAGKITTMSSMEITSSNISFGIMCNNNMTPEKVVNIRTALNNAIKGFNAYCPIFFCGNTRIVRNHHKIIIHFL